jgi:hypothetical protein
VKIRQTVRTEHGIKCSLLPGGWPLIGGWLLLLIHFPGKGILQTPFGNFSPGVFYRFRTILVIIDMNHLKQLFIGKLGDLFHEALIFVEHWITP